MPLDKLWAVSMVERLTALSLSKGFAGQADGLACSEPLDNLAQPDLVSVMGR